VVPNGCGRPGRQVVNGAGHGRRGHGRCVVLYEHASALVREHGESGWTGRLIPLTVDGVVYAGSMAMLDSVGRAPGLRG
jgi:hypothetical protein